jgi:adenine-specific DNA-methyltransferase
MPTLNWIGKDKVINHAAEVPYRILERKYTYGDENIGLNDGGNMIIRGDNLAALKSLLPMYEGRVKCIYIDPPYNTGNEGWIYNDNVNDPKIKKWLGEVVGREGEDLSRHDKWLCMMYPRLKLLQRLLTDDGALVISIGYQELNNLIMICREFFSTKQIVCVTVQTSGGKPSGGFNYLHEYLVFITPRDFEPNPLSFAGGNERTPYEGLTLSTFNKTQRPNQTYPIFIDKASGLLVGVGKSLQERIDSGEYIGSLSDFPYDFSEAPDGTVALWPISSKGNECVWRLIPSRLLGDWQKGYIKVGNSTSSKNPNSYSIQYLPEGVIKKILKGELSVVGKEPNAPTLSFGGNTTVGSQIPTIWNEKSFFTVKGTSMINEIFGEKKFEYSKPEPLIEEVIRAISHSEDIILDSFAGSGTTAHAVLNMNKADGGNRKFILVEMEDYAETITAERIRRVIDGYSDKEGTGGGFSFYELGEVLMFPNGNLNEEVDVTHIREYVWYMETKSPIQTQKSDNQYYLGELGGTVYYFLYERERATTLDGIFLTTVEVKASHYVIYADRCVLSDKELGRYNITFKKIPRDIETL